MYNMHILLSSRGKLSPYYFFLTFPILLKEMTTPLPNIVSVKGPKCPLKDQWKLVQWLAWYERSLQMLRSSSSGAFVELQRISADASYNPLYKTV